MCFINRKLRIQQTSKQTNKLITTHFFWKKVIFEARQILHILWNPKVENHVYKKAPPVSLFKTKVIKSATSYLRQAFSSGVSYSEFLTNNFYASLFSPCMLHTPPILYFSYNNNNIHQGLDQFDPFRLQSYNCSRQRFFGLPIVLLPCGL